MTPPVRLFSRAWLALPLGAIGFLVWINHARLQRVEYVSSLPGRAEPVDVLVPASPTGYAHGQRELIVPEHNENSFRWIAQTQQMFSRREWRVRRVDYDNAPFGRAEHSASPYRWWLGLMAWLDHVASGRPLGLSVERAALFADPAWQGLLVLAGTILVAWQFGRGAAALFAAGLVTIFPFAAGFLPGAPDDHGLANSCALGSILALVAGMYALGSGLDEAGAGTADRRARRWFALAGVIGGLGVWVGVSTQIPILAGVLLGALMAAWTVRRSRAGTPHRDLLVPPWRLWGCAGGTTILLAYLTEYFPAALGAWRLEWIHPLYGLAWMGASELLMLAVAWIQRGENPFWRARDVIAAMLGAAAIAAVPVTMKLTDSRGFLAVNPLSFRLTGQPHGVVASSFWAWLVRDGFTATVWATVLPVLLVLPAAWLIIRHGGRAAAKASLALSLGPVVIALAFACWQLSWWQPLDGTLLVLAVAALPENLALRLRSGRWLWTGLAALLMIPGVYSLWPQRISRTEDKLTSSEAEDLIARDLAHWLAAHAGDEGAVVFAPPRETASLSFYGGLGGIGTFAPDNSEGLRATITIASVTTLPEAEVLVRARRIKYIVLPSWDPFFDEYARLYLVKTQSSRKSILIPELRRLNLPGWLRPLPFQMLKIGGYETQSVLVFEVVDEQSPAVAMSRLAEYLVETGELEHAAAVGRELRRFPGDVGALAARAQVESARSDAANLAQSVDLLLARLSTGADRYLPWDRRVSLAIVLARADRLELAREQVHRCLAALDEKKARSLSIGSLFNLLVLSRDFRDPITDPQLRASTLDLLPSELRDRL
ncbi:MAG TPA: hypothetical protein VLW52_05955 [Opitutaceae bacterium]|nr:hypothetical protein [Opitutaceae bacterium]